MTDQGGAGGTREPGGAGALTGSDGDEGAGSHGGAAGVEIDWTLGPEWGLCHHPRCPR